MGSKNLKAIAVRGTQKPKYADEGRLIDLSLKELDNKGENARKYYIILVINSNDTV